MKNKYILPIISSFLILILILISLVLYDDAKKCDGYVIADWLVNFQAGFVRRGLGGYLIICLSDFINLKPNFTVLIIQIIFYIGYTLVLYFLIRKKEINIWFLILLLSPVTLLFPLLSDTIGRKEIILFFLFGLYILCLNKKKANSFFTIFLFSFALMVATLFHELIFFYTPYFILAAYLQSKIDQMPLQFKKIILIPLGSFLVMLPLFLFGKHINGSAICSGLIERGLSDNICKGLFMWPEDFNVWNYSIAKGYYLSYSISFLLGLVPFIIYLKLASVKLITFKKIGGAFFFLFLFTLPLFIASIDWGRWLNIHFVMLLFISTFFLKDKVYNSKFLWSNENITLPNFLNSKTSASKFLNNQVFIILCFSYITLWGMRGWGTFSFFSYSIVDTLVRVFSPTGG